MSLSDKATILPIQPEDVDHYLDFAIPCIQSALEHTDDETRLSDILSDIDNQAKQLWIIKDQGEYLAAIITEIYTTQSGFKIGEIFGAGGKNHEKWDHFVDVVGEWFKAQGCDTMQIIGRPGWKKLYEPRGFVHKYTVLRRKL